MTYFLGHTVLRGKKSETCSGTEKTCTESDLPLTKSALPGWMASINQHMKKLGAIDLWTQREFDILANAPTLKGENLWLSDVHFHYFILLFNNQFKSFQRMQQTFLADCATGLKKIKVKEDFIQPVHAADNHWAMVTNIGVPQDEREFTTIAYDSLINMVSKDQCQIREKMKWQAVQLLRPETHGMQLYLFMK
jgi:hypothetical protein